MEKEEVIDVLQPKEPNIQWSSVEGINSVLDDSPALQDTSMEIPEVIKSTPEEKNISIKNSVAKQENEGVITIDNPGYFGANDKYSEVLPYKLNIFGEEVETTSTDPHKIAFEIATKYNGRSAEDYFGYYYSPTPLKESIGSAFLKGAIQGVGGLIGGVGGVINAGAQGIASLSEYLAGGQSDAITESTKAFGDWVSSQAKGFQDKFLYEFAADQYLDDSMRTQIAGGVGGALTSMGLFAAARAFSISGKISAAVLNGDVFNDTYQKARDNGFSHNSAVRNSIASLGIVAGLDAFGFEKWASMFRGVTKRAAAKSLQKIASNEMLDMASRTTKQQVGRSIERGLETVGIELTGEELQNFVPRILSGNMGNDYWENYFEEDLVTAASTLIATALGIPFEVRRGLVEQKYSKDFVNNTMTPLKDLVKVHDMFLDKLTVGKKIPEEKANAFIDDLLVYGVEYVKKEHSDAMNSLLLSVSEKDISDFYERYKKIKPADFSDQRFKDLDLRVQKSLEDVDLAISDKLLIRGLYQGIANWMAYRGISPDAIEVASFTRDLGRNSPDAAGSFDDENNVIYIRKDTLSKKEESAVDNIIEKNFKNGFDLERDMDAMADALSSKLKITADEAKVVVGLYAKKKIGLDGTSPYDTFVEKLSKDKTISQRMKTIIHEMAHLLDFSMLGLNKKDLKKFLDVYLDTIEKVFGTGNAGYVDNKLFEYQEESNLYDENGEVDFNEAAVQDKNYARDNRGFNGYNDPSVDMTSKNAGTDVYTSYYNSTEWFAQAMGRLGKEAAEAIGLKGTPADYVMFVNAMLRGQDNLVALSKPVQKYLDAFKNMVKNNSSLVKAMVERSGVDNLNSALLNFLDNPSSDFDWKGVTYKDIKSLAEMADSYTNSESSSMLENIFKDIDLGNIQRSINGLDMFNTALDNPDIQTTDPAYQAATIFGDKQIVNGEPVLSNDVSVNNILEDQIKIQNKKEKSPLEKQLSTKVGGYTLDEDIEFMSNAIKEKEQNKPLSKFWKIVTRFLDNLGLDGYTWALGGQKALDHFNLIHKHEMFDDINSELHTNFANRIQKEVLNKEKAIDPGYSMDLQKFENDCSVKRTEVDYIDPRNGRVIKRKLSTFDLMNIKLVARQTERALDENGNPVGLSPHDRLQKSLPNDKIEDLVSLLTPAQNKYADILSEEVNKAFDRLVAAYKEHGVDIDLGKGNKNYWMLLDALSQSMGKDYTVTTIKRNIYADSALGIFDAREQFNRYMSHVAGVESEFYSTVKRLKDIFSYTAPEGSLAPDEIDVAKKYIDSSRKMFADGEYRLGADLFKRFNSLLDDFLTNRSESLVSQSLLSKAARNITTGILSWKPIQFVKNTSNFFSFWGLAEDQAQYWKDTVNGILHAPETWKFMMEHSAVVRKRMKGQSYNEFLNASTSGGDNFVAEVFKNANGTRWYNASASALNNYIALTQVFKKAGLSPMLYGDATANIFGGYALLQQYIKKYNGDIKQASIAFDEAILRRQSSSNQALRSLTQRSWNRKASGNLLTFTTEGVQKWSNIIQTLEQVNQGELSVKQGAMSVASVLSSTIAYALISACVIDLIGEDDEDKKEHVYDSLTTEAISSIAGASIFGNAFITPFVNEAMGKRSAGISVAAGTEFLNMARNLSKGDFSKLLQQIGGASGAFVGLPNAMSVVNGVKRAVTAETPEERRAGVRQAGGRTENFANKREGIKQKPLTKEEE